MKNFTIIIASILFCALGSQKSMADAVEFPASMASGTLPVMYINTENGAAIVDKETQIPAGMWIDIPENCPDKDFKLGTEDSPITLKIKGRGNSTWEKEKKPYKLKFDSKTALLGMPKHKHFALLAGYGGGGNMLSPMVGMELAKLIDLGWASRNYPVELVINGEYLGVYSLFESVKIDSNRLDIFEQDDEETDPETIPYGWLVEIDNTVEENQILIENPQWTKLRITYHTPEVLSEAQEQWLVDSFTELNSVINSSDRSVRETWVEFLDPVSVARYFIIVEILRDNDGFNGSLYLHRDKKEDAKWVMGPMWDAQICSYGDVPTDWTMNQLPSYSVWKIIPEIFYTEAFSNAFKQEWDAFYPQKFNQLESYLKDISGKLSEGMKADKQRWPITQLIDENKGLSVFKEIGVTAKWVDENKNYYEEYSSISDVLDEGNLNMVGEEYYDLTGRRVVGALGRGAYVKVTTYADGSHKAEKVVK